MEWSGVESCADIDEACESFYSIINDITSKHVPRFRSGRFKFPAWYTGPVIRTIREKNRVRRRLRRRYDLSDDVRFRVLRFSLRTEIRLAYLSYVNSVESSICDEPKKFWNFIKSIRNASRILSSVVSLERTCSDPKDIVNAFADFFLAVCFAGFVSAASDFLEPDFLVFFVSSPSFISVCESVSDDFAILLPDFAFSFSAKTSAATAAAASPRAATASMRSFCLSVEIRLMPRRFAHSRKSLTVIAVNCVLSMSKALLDAWSILFYRGFKRKPMPIAFA